MYIQYVPSSSLQVIALCPGPEVANDFSTRREKHRERRVLQKKNKELFVRKQTKKITPILPTISISPRMHYLTFEKKNLLLDCNTERQPKLDTIILIKYITKF